MKIPVRGDLPYIHVDEPDPNRPPDTCPVCGHDTLYRFPLISMSSRGVIPIGFTEGCIDCAEAKRRHHP